MSLNRKDYFTVGQANKILFSKQGVKKIERMNKEITLVSNVCPDYPNDGEKYTFSGKLGSGISLSAKAHIDSVPCLINDLCHRKINIKWIILVADLPEISSGMEEFYCRVAENREKYLECCENSAKAIQEKINGLAKVETFSSFYQDKGIDYLQIQEIVEKNILDRQGTDRDFKIRFSYFMNKRALLSMMFRGRELSEEENKKAAAHAMSLYMTQGTLLRKIFLNQNLIVINHETLNIKNFFDFSLVPNSDYLAPHPKFPVGVIEGELY